MSSKWASHGEKDEGFIPALQEVHRGSWSNAQHYAIDEFRESWGEDMARDLELIHVDTNWHTTSNTNFHHENNGVMTWLSLDIIGSNISGTSGRLHTFPSSFKHYAAHGFWTGQLHWETTILELSVEARYSKRNPGPPSLSQRDVEAPGAGGKCFQPQQVSFGCETWW